MSRDLGGPPAPTAYPYAAQRRIEAFMSLGVIVADRCDVG
ncbi:hypothetical protein ATCCBAA256_01300 [Mycobacterium montefiorense]|nr:hypothetical protein ATCCBAA256_01300 [Mycobacterium montefiorense]